MRMPIVRMALLALCGGALSASASGLRPGSLFCVASDASSQVTIHRILAIDDKGVIYTRPFTNLFETCPDVAARGTASLVAQSSGRRYEWGEFGAVKLQFIDLGELSKEDEAVLRRLQRQARSR